jgi:hypothetical protein
MDTRDSQRVIESVLKAYFFKVSYVLDYYLKNMYAKFNDDRLNSLGVKA